MNKKINCFFLLAIAFLIGTKNVQTQNMHFSQIDNIPLFLNPALTANDKDVDYRFAGNFRQQNTLTSADYTTYNAWADLALKPNFLNNSWVGLGVLYANDKANGSFLNKTQIISNVAFHKEINDNHILSVGTSLYYELNKIDQNELIYEDQWNGIVYDRNLPSFDMLVQKNQSITFGVGLNYNYVLDEKFNINIGGGMYNINRPQKSFINSLGSSLKINQNNIVSPFLYHLHTGSIWQLSDQVINKTNAYLALQSAAYEFVFGTYFKVYTYPESSIAFLMGASYRWGASFIALAGIEINNFQLMLSYDAGVNKTTNFVFYNNALELSGIFKLNFVEYEIGQSGRNNRIKCKF